MYVYFRNPDAIKLKVCLSHIHLRPSFSIVDNPISGPSRKEIQESSTSQHLEIVLLIHSRQSPTISEHVFDLYSTLTCLLRGQLAIWTGNPASTPLPYMVDKSRTQSTARERCPYTKLPHTIFPTRLMERVNSLGPGTDMSTRVWEIQPIRSSKIEWPC